MKILITGATGLLGSKFYHILNKYHDVLGTYFSDYKEGYCYLSLLDKDSINSVIDKSKPDVVIHTAGMANPDKCEENKEKAYKVNVTGTKYVVDACKRNSTTLVFISSSHVFTKKNKVEEEKPNPINYYGQTKFEAEAYVRKNIKDYIILRLTKLYGFTEEGNDFTKYVINKLKNNHRVSMDNTLKYYPLVTDDVVELSRILIDSGLRGTYNISTSKPYTKFEWAKLIAEVFNLDKTKLKPIEEKTIAKRPQNLYFFTKTLRGFDFNPTPLEVGLKIVKKQMGCMFRMIYTTRPDVLVLNQNASSFRIKIGEILAKKYPQNVDLVTAIPESGLFEATGYAAYMKIPFYFGIIRDYFTDKTLFSPNIDQRLKALRKKLIIVKDVVKGKSIVLIDESIISGATLKTVVQRLKEAGVKEVHVRVPSPIMVSNCKYNILAPDARLIARDFVGKEGVNKEEIEDKMAKHFKVDSLKYLSIEEFLSELIAKEDACIDCFRYSCKNS